MIVFFLAVSFAFAQDAKRELLWPNGAPDAKGDKDRDKPFIEIHLAGQGNGTAVIVCPGGGYADVMMTYEGAEVAEWLNGLGISAFVLRYRVAPRYRYPAPMQDITRAIRLVRSRADEWKISRVGVLGFSAGGHLASYAMTHFDDGNEKAEDLIERAGSRPDFGVLVYPVVSMDPPYGHAGSRKNLLGKSEAPEELSTDKCVTEKTPPCFLVHTSGDTAVPVENSIAFYLALRKAKVPAELHVYEKGEHGYGLGKKDPVLSAWPERCAAWFKSRGY